MDTTDTTTVCARCGDKLVTNGHGYYFTGFEVLCDSCMFDLALIAWKAEKKAKRDATPS